MHRSFRPFIRCHFLQQVTTHKNHSATDVSVLPAGAQLGVMLDCTRSRWLGQALVAALLQTQVTKKQTASRSRKHASVKTASSLLYRGHYRD